MSGEKKGYEPSKDLSQEIKELQESPNGILDYVAKLGDDLKKYAEQAKAMLEIAEERGISVNLEENTALRKFEATGEYEIMLINLRAELISLTTTMFLQGLKVTASELKDHLAKKQTKK